ncbi:G-type lectin S-receptor-like serine/threonine-protein kinase SD1-13 [Corylus avellana]|uniref:G-type lectin S-receptor-like serine/threonine-protein kinase SD1-13 n=1 Tax=Corylus avellana TaxID=13451 RepID=UPI00286D3CFD|nr:G-type lectin S-receptor-like serine/threonine-protein kinase SD1-13 [Corylus avellana]
MAAFHGSSSSSCSSSSSSFSSLASSISRCTYDVFLSFRGKDTRKTFTAHLYAALCRNDVNTFMDNKLRSGEEISPALLEAIKESAISIIVLSKNYASSQWCLDELMKILECKKTRGQQILPLFYHVHPSEVRNQTNSVRKAFAKLQERFKHDQMKLRRWKTALSQIGNLSGKLLGNRNEPEFIHEIIQLVNSMLVKNTYFQVAEYPESHVQYVKPLLDLEKNDSTCMVGIFEIGGIDKTTIAKAIYNSIASLTEESKKSDETNLVLHKLDNERHLKDLMNTSKFREEDEKGIDILYFHLERIVVATDGFSYANMIGKGGFGYVYKGTFLGGQQIAVKRLSSASSQGFQEFKNEVALIKNLQHRNIVRLRGYCMEGDEKILLYEYMRKGSLDSFIFDRNPSKYLDWEMRVNIIWGIARGLLYLHHDSRLRIIHRDLKPSNILLDEEMNPKIADFGCATIAEGKNIEARTMRIVGT